MLAACSCSVSKAASYKLLLQERSRTLLLKLFLMTTNLQEVVTDENLYNTIPGIALKYIQIMKIHL